jgi:Flp pilus assembly protein TadG
MTRAQPTSKESSMSSRQGRPRRSEGQILVVFALGLIVMIAGVALVLEGGNAYQQQRSVQNGADAGANAGATVIAQSLAGVPKTDADVLSAITSSGFFNTITSVAYYTNVYGEPINANGNAVGVNAAVQVGAGPAGAMPPNAQGVHVGGTRTFPTTIARAIGFNAFTASAEATAITGRATGGRMMPVVFPVNITDCSGNGNLGLGKDQWDTSQPNPPGHPNGTEYIVPLCKTGAGSFMVLNMDGIMNNCDDEATSPTAVQWDSFPVDVPSDNGNNCAKPLADAVNEMQGETVMIPICDDNACNTSGGSNATYHVTGVVGFYVDYMSDSNSTNNPLCMTHTNADGETLVTISGNGSSSCIAGWFVRFITIGPVGAGQITNADAIGIQLIK